MELARLLPLEKKSLLDLPCVGRCQILGILLLLLILFIYFIGSCARLLLCCHSFCVCLFPCLCPPSLPLLAPLLPKVHSCFPWPKVHLVIVMSVSLLSQVR